MFRQCSRIYLTAEKTKLTELKTPLLNWIELVDCYMNLNQQFTK